MQPRVAKSRVGSTTIVTLVALAAIGCEDLLGGDSVCTLISVPALEVFLQDADTDEPVTDEDARVLVVDDSFATELETHGGGVFRGPYERPGRYTITAISPGYEPWGREDVLVRSDHCHVQTVELAARLVPDTWP